MARAIDIQPIIEEIKSSLDISSYSEHDKGFDDGLEYVLDLIEKAPTLAPPNEPLMLDELRQMGGEPVWVQTPGIPKYGRWVIVAGVDTEDGQRTLYCQGNYTCRNYGRDWIAYRRPKEGEANGE